MVCVVEKIEKILEKHLYNKGFFKLKLRKMAKNCDYFV